MKILSTCMMLALTSFAFSVSAAQPAANAASDKSLWSNGKATCHELPAAASTRLDLIRQMLATGKPHAALAYLDAGGGDAPQAMLLRADGLRQTGRTEEAGRLYRQLLPSCVGGYAHQGLALMASQAGRWTEAVQHLKAAAAAQPIDPAVRNDYGYALMMAGENEAALHEFLTAVELSPGARGPERNLLLLLARTGQDDKAAAFADKAGISREELERIRATATHPSPTAAGTSGIPETSGETSKGARDESENMEMGGLVADRHDGLR